MTENDVSKAIIEYLTMTGWLVLRINSGAIKSEYKGRKRYFNFVRWFASGRPGQQTKGVSDILAFSPDGGRLLAIECKRPGKETNVSDDQRIFLREVNRRQALGIVASDVQQVIDTLELL